MCSDLSTLAWRRPSTTSSISTRNKASTRRRSNCTRNHSKSGPASMVATLGQCTWTPRWSCVTRSQTQEETLVCPVACVLNWRDNVCSQTKEFPAVLLYFPAVHKVQFSDGDGPCSHPAGQVVDYISRESVLFIGTQFSNLYTAVDTPARGRVGVVCGVCVWCLRVSMFSDVLGSLSLRTPVMPLPAPWLSHFAVCPPDLPQTTPQLVQAPPPPCARPPPIPWA